jgi:hypothetical protein
LVNKLAGGALAGGTCIFARGAPASRAKELSLLIKKGLAKRSRYGNISFAVANSTSGCGSAW